MRACEFAGPLALLNVVVRCQRLLFSKFMKHIVKGDQVGVCKNSMRKGKKEKSKIPFFIWKIPC